MANPMHQVGGGVQIHPLNLQAAPPLSYGERAAIQRTKPLPDPPKPSKLQTIAKHGNLLLKSFSTNSTSILKAISGEFKKQWSELKLDAQSFKKEAGGVLKDLKNDFIGQKPRQEYALDPLPILPGAVVQLRPGEKIFINPAGRPPGDYIGRPRVNVNHAPLGTVPGGIPVRQVEEPKFQNIPVSQINIQALASNMENLTNEQKLHVIAHLKDQVSNNKNLSSAQKKNINDTLKAAEHLLKNPGYWNEVSTHIEKMYAEAPVVEVVVKGPDGKDKIIKKKVLTKEQYAQIKSTVSNKLGLLCHPEAGDIRPLLKESPELIVQSYLTAVKNNNVENFVTKGFGQNQEVCFEARNTPIQIWLQSATVADPATQLNLNVQDQDQYQVLGDAYTKFKETQLRAFFEKNHKEKYEKENLIYGMKMSYSGPEWDAFKEKIEKDPKFNKDYHNQAKFLEFLQKELVPNVSTLKGGLKLTQENIGEHLNALMELSNPFE